MKLEKFFLLAFIGAVFCAQSLRAEDPEASTAYESPDELQTAPAQHNGGRMAVQSPEKKPQFIVSAEPRMPKTGYHMGVMAGATLWQDASYDDGAPDYDETNKLGPYFGVKFGYDWAFEDEPIEQWKREVGPENDGVRVSGGLELEAFMLQNAFEGSTSAGAVKTDLYTGVGMVNLLMKLQWGKFRPYFGPGIGLAYTFADDYTAPGGAPHDTDSTVSLAWQGIIGTDYFISPDWSVFGEYKFLDLHGVDLFGPTNQIDMEDYYHQIVAIGIRKHF
jgi:opacity protein-like surface antigen